MRLPRHASLTHSIPKWSSQSSSHERSDVSRNLLPFLPSLLLCYVWEQMDQRSLFFICMTWGLIVKVLAVVVMLSRGLRVLYVVNALMTSAVVIRAQWLNSPNQSYRAFFGGVPLFPLCYHSVILTWSLNLYCTWEICSVTLWNYPLMSCFTYVHLPWKTAAKLLLLTITTILPLNMEPLLVHIWS